MKKTKISATA